MQRGLSMREHFHWLSRPCTWSLRELRYARGVINPVRRYQSLRHPLDGPVMRLTRLSRYHAHLTRTLEKWSAKVAAVAPSALLPASRKRFTLAGGMKEGVKSVGTQIEDMFQSGWPAFLSRTQLKRCKGHEEGGGDKGSDGDEEVFDDTDFYQQLLRDVIESKGGGSGQLMGSQRRKNAKKKVDTRASKGRKLRLVIFIGQRGLPDWHTTGTKCTKR